MKKVIMLQEGNYGKRHWFTSQKDADKFYTENFLNGGKELNQKVFEMKDNENIYAVHIAESWACPTDSNAMYTVARNESHATRIGREYIRRWGIEDQSIIKVAKIA